MPRTISVAMIVKDEARHLAECLDVISQIADEICIVDTGSTDETIAIAREYNARTSVFIWCDDFSAARNESLRQCEGDWVLVIDADERIAPEDVAKVRALVEGATNVCYRFATRNYTNTETVGEFQPCAPDDPWARGFAGWYPSVKVRLFPNRVGARFEGRVHELVHQSLERQGIEPLLCDVPIHHYPFLRTPEQILEKQERYLQLGHEKLAANPDDPNAYAELGNQYADVRDYANAAGAYRESLKRDPSNPAVMKDLGGVLHLLKRSEEAKRALKLALQLDPALAEAWRNLGVVYADEKQWPLARECFQCGLDSDPSWADGHRYLSVALEADGRMDEAAAEAQKAVALSPDRKPALKLYLHQMLRLEKRTQAREFLGGLLADGAAAATIHNALGELFYYDRLFEEAISHFSEAGRLGSTSAYNNLGVVLHHQARYAEAKEAFEKCLEADPGHRGARANIEKTLKYLNEH